MFDVAVVGGGLAGCSAALALAQRGRSVLLLEATSYPHDKVCGEFLSPECLPLLNASGFLPTLQSLNPVTIRTVRITSPDGSAWRSDFPTPALGISRYALDAALAGFAGSRGVMIKTGMRVTGVAGSLRDSFLLTARSVTGTETFQAAAVLIAHGKRSNLDRSFERSFLRQRQPYLGLKRHFSGPPLLDQLDLHVFPGGYCGMSQVEGGQTNICLLVRQEVYQRTAGSAPASVERFITWMCGQNADLDRWLSQATPLSPEWLAIGQVPLVTKTPVEGDLLFAGDAAAMIAPLAGDGMAMALHSGQLAAAALDRYLARQIDAETMKRSYAREWRSTFQARLRMGRLLHAVLMRPTPLALGLRLLNRLPALGNVLVMQTRGLGLVER